MMSAIQSFVRRAGVAVLTLAIAFGVFAAIAPTASAATHTVEMTTSLKFQPASVTAAPGDTIVWENKAGLPHNVVFEDAAKFDGGKMKELGQLLGKGTVELTLPNDLPSGTYKYYCTPHRGAGMAGEIVVQ